MLIVRVARGIGDHFPARVSEWALASILFGWGWILLGPQPTFEHPAYAMMAAIATEDWWGTGAMTVGALRLAALIINGTFASTRYSRWSPHVRSVVAFLSCFFWVQISISLFVGLNPPGTGLAVYPVLLALDVFNTFRAARDAKQSDTRARNEPGHR